MEPLLPRVTREVFVREEVEVEEQPERPLCIEEVVTSVYETSTVEKHIRHFQKIVEVERRVPEFQVIEQEVEIESDIPRIVKTYVEVPQVVEETVIVPRVIETEKLIETVVPITVHRIVEKVIEKPSIVEVPKLIRVDKDKPYPGTLSTSEIPLVVSHVIQPPVVRTEGEVHVPVIRIVPKVEYVDVQIPKRFIPNRIDLAALLQKHVKCRLIHQGYQRKHDSERLTNNGEALPITSVLEDDHVHLDIKSGSIENSNVNGLSIDFKFSRAQGRFTASDYNSWLLLVNEHLNDPVSLGFGEDDQENIKATLLNQLPFIREKDGTVQFLEPGSPMEGHILRPSRGRMGSVR